MIIDFYMKFDRNFIIRIFTVALFFIGTVLLQIGRDFWTNLNELLYASIQTLLILLALLGKYIL